MFDLMQSVELLHVFIFLSHPSFSFLPIIQIFGILDEGGLFGADGRLLNCTGHSGSCSNQTSVQQAWKVFVTAQSTKMCQP